MFEALSLWSKMKKAPKGALFHSGNLTEKAELSTSFHQVFGRSERIRTSDPLLPKQVRYQAALRSDHVG
jgi:hypothetical protein